MALMIFTFVILCGLILLIVYAFVELAKWPGRVARERRHPQADAVAALAWGGLILTAGLAWLAALVWAKSAPASADPGDDRDARLAVLGARLRELEGEFQALKA